MARIYGKRWQTDSKLGAGGQAEVFLVRDLQNPDAPCSVLKRLKNPKRIQRFTREIDAVRRLQHPNLLTLLDFDPVGDEPYLVTEYCGGGSLDKAPRFWAGSPEVALDVFDGICAAVEYAHTHNVIHRDLKPENIFLRAPGGPPVVGDFGICFIDDDGTRVTLTDEAVGTRFFIAPELEDGKASDVTPACDTYSLGKLLYWLLSGGRLFNREKHRIPDFDLRGRNPDHRYGWNNIYLEHVNRVLDFMLAPLPSDRRPVSNVRILARHAKEFLRIRAIPLGPGLPQPCTYCQQGLYVEPPLRGRNTIEKASNLGLGIVGDPDWRVLSCSACGHVQLFRADFASRKDWWPNS